MKYLKKPIPVHVDFASTSGFLKTLEGVVSFKPGDALVTGIAGENWPIDRSRFEETYLPLDSEMQMGESGRYLKKPMLVDAERVSTQQTIRLPDGSAELLAKKGDWILTSPDGHVWVVADAIFAESYELENESESL